MGGHARLGHHVHRLGAHLKLDVQTRGTHQRGVQGLITVDLGDGDVVLEAPGHRLVELVQDAHGGVTVGHAGHDEAYAVDIVHLGKAQVLAVHLAVDRVERFLTTVHANLQAGFVESRLHFLLNPLQQIASPTARAHHGFVQHLVTPGHEVAERQILQLAVTLVQPQAVGNGGIDFQRLAGDAMPLGARHVAQGTHVVAAISQFD